MKDLITVVQCEELKARTASVPQGRLGPEVQSPPRTVKPAQQASRKGRIDLGPALLAPGSFEPEVRVLKRTTEEMVRADPQVVVSFPNHLSRWCPTLAARAFRAVRVGGRNQKAFTPLDLHRRANPTTPQSRQAGRQTKARHVSAGSGFQPHVRQPPRCHPERSGGDSHCESPPRSRRTPTPPQLPRIEHRGWHLGGAGLPALRQDGPNKSGFSRCGSCFWVEQGFQPCTSQRSSAGFSPRGKVLGRRSGIARPTRAGYASCIPSPGMLCKQSKVVRSPYEPRRYDVVSGFVRDAREDQ